MTQAIDGTADSAKNSPAAVAGSELLLSLFKLLQMVKIHQANNKLVVDTIAEFRAALKKICSESDGAHFRLHRARFYMNHVMLAFPASMQIPVTKLMEYFQARGIQGLRLYDNDNSSAEDIVHVVGLLNKAVQENEPVAWLQVQLDTANFTWVEFLSDQDTKAKGGLSGAEAAADAETASSSPAAAAAAAAAAGKGRRAAPTPTAEVAQRTYHQVMASMARKTYSHALSSVLSMTDKYSMNKRVGIQKSKRVIQGMIEILTKDESILLGMTTIRNYDDYTYTHSVNVAILSMCLGRRLGLPRQLIEILGLSGLFHDLGKVDVPIHLINKNSGLTETEYEKIKEHPLNSVRQIIRLNADHALKAKLLLPPFEHHLGINLLGYPKIGRKAPLSLLGRVLAVADQYDAMTSSRSYRRNPISPDVALKYMLEDSGSVLDP
ncbi:MAG: HD domain-containing protein, partial [Candidatus Adiutrix sp.]|nr:HD domain-containing protein [Candidatus Adiutrix sp.]